jgi:hypothetical protein
MLHAYGSELAISPVIADDEGHPFKKGVRFELRLTDARTHDTAYMSNDMERFIRLRFSGKIYQVPAEKALTREEVHERWLWEVMG